MDAKIIILGSSAAHPFPRTKTNKFEDYLDVKNYREKFDLHDDEICNSAKRGGKDRRTRACLALSLEIRNHKLKTILFDAGPDIKYQLEKYKIKPNAVFISHDHEDADYGLKYLSKSVKILSEKSGTIKHGKIIKFLGAEILPFRVAHSDTAPCTGYLIRLKNENGKRKINLRPEFRSRENQRTKSFVYMTDMASIEGIKKYVKDCDILFADGSILNRNFGGHLAIIKQLRFYKKWRLKRVIFTHIGHATLKHEDLLRFIRGQYKNAEVAYDGMVIQF